VVDRTTVFGLTALAGLLAWMVLAGAGWAAGAFWQTSAVAFVVGGAAIAALVASPGTGPKRLGAILQKAFTGRTSSPDETIITLVALAEVARRDGLLALDKPVAGLRDDFTRRAMEMAIDGAAPEVIQAVCQAELESIDLRHAEGKAVLESMARYAPAFGMMGTLIGLVVMLGKMDDPARIGPGMAVALLTTLYGLAMANLFCLPLARRLSYLSSQELLGKTIALRGVLGIQAGDNPRVLAGKLRAYLPGAGRGQEFSWATLTRKSTQAERIEAAGAPAGESGSAATSPGPVSAQPAIDEETARRMAEQLQRILRGQKRDAA
jgi:chemotaxis protein MotA